MLIFYKKCGNKRMSRKSLITSVHFSSVSNEWETPDDLYRSLNERFKFTLDPCCTHENAKCEKHYTMAENGLVQDWSTDIVFLNPPYGREISKWIKKAYLESEKGATVVCLIPARTDTSYWHDYIFGKAKIEFLRGRIKFVNGRHQQNSAPFPSAIVIFDPKQKENKTNTWVTQKPDYACIFLTRHKWKDNHEYSLWKFDWVEGGVPEDAPYDENVHYYYLGWFENDGDEWDDIEACNYDEYFILEKLPTLKENK